MTGETSKGETRIAVYLTESEAQLFKEFQVHYPVIKAIIKGKVNEVRSGTATLYFDPQGTLTKIETQEVVYHQNRNVV